MNAQPDHGLDATKKLPGEGFKRPWPPLIKMADAHFALSLALKELGQFDAAERHLREAIRLRPSLEATLKPK